MRVNKRMSSWLLVWMPHTVGSLAYGVVMITVLYFIVSRAPGFRSAGVALPLMGMVEAAQCFGWFALLRSRYGRFPPGISGQALLVRVSAHCGAVSLAWGILTMSSLMVLFRLFPVGFHASVVRPTPSLAMLVAVLVGGSVAFAFNAAWITSLWSAVHWTRRSLQEAGFRGEQEAKARALAHQSQLQMLRYQLNPHFLFNALNSVRALVQEDPSRAERMIDDLADLLRYSLSRSGAADVTLREEVEAAKSYLALEKVRFEERLQLQWKVQEDALDCPVPGFLLNPLVENAVKYGMETSAGGAVKVEVSIRRDAGGLELVVANSGRWLPHGGSASGTGTGLNNVRARLEQRFPGRFQLSTHPGEGQVEVRLRLPVEAPVINAQPLPPPNEVAA